MIDNEGRLNETYSSATAEQWRESKTMEHASGIWGRDKMFKYLKEQILSKGDNVADLGSGGGFPTVRIAEMVGPEGKVVGVEYNEAQLGLKNGQEPLSEKYKALNNVQFIRGDVREIPLKTEAMDKSVSFMVLNNLDIEGVKSTFKETARILKPGGRAVFLTMHPEILNSEQWDLDFWKFDEEDLKKYKQAADKEGVEVRAKVKNVSGGEKSVFMNNHTRKNIEDALQDAELKLTDQQDIWIDEKTAIEKFGTESTKKLPTKPAFWMITVEK